MPLTKCSAGGKSGWKWGDKGACYTGKDAKKKALKQGYAEGPEKFKEEVAKGHISFREAEEAVRELRSEKEEKASAGTDFMGSVQVHLNQKKQ